MAVERGRSVAARTAFFAGRYILLAILAFESFHATSRLPATAVFTGGLLDQSDAVEAGTLGVFRIAMTCAFVLAVALAEWLARSGHALRRRISVAVWVLLVVGLAPFFLIQLVFVIAFEPVAATTTLAPVAVLAGLYLWRKLSWTFLLVLIAFTISTNFEHYIKGNRQVEADDLLRIVNQPGVRPLILTPSRPADALEAYNLLVGFDVQEILVDPDERYVYASTGTRPEPICPLARVDLETGAMETIPISTGFQAMAFDSKRRRLYTGTDMTAAEIVVVDVDSFRVIERHDAVMRGEKPSIEVLFFDEKRDLLWVFHEWGTVEKWTVEPFELVGAYKGYGMHQFVYIEKTRDLFFHNHYVPPGLMRYRLTDRPTLIGRRLFPIAGAITFNPVAGGIYLSDPFLGRVWLIDPVDMSTIESFRATFGIKNIAFDARRNLIYTGNYVSGDLCAYDATTHEEVFRVYLGQRFRGIRAGVKTGRVVADTARGVFEIDVDRLRQ